MKTVDTETYKHILLKEYEEKRKTLLEEIKRIQQKEERLNEVTIFNALDLGKAVAHLVSLMENEEYTFFELESSRFYTPIIELYPDETLIDSYLIKKSSEESLKNEIKSLYNSFDIERNRLLESDKYKKSTLFEKKELESKLRDYFQSQKYNPNNSYILFSTHLLGNNIDVNRMDMGIYEELMLFRNEKINERFKYINDFIEQVVQQRISKIKLNSITEEKSLEKQAEDYAKSHSNELRLTIK